MISNPRVQGAAGCVLLLWAGVLVMDVRKLRSSEAFKASPLGKEEVSFTLFGRRSGGGE
jgi:hypothetical protein